MAKVTAPLLSMGAQGQIGKTQVYAKWKGVDYARRYVTPANPQSSSQTETRTVFYWAVQTWKLMSSAVQAAWTAAAKGQPMTDRNMFIAAAVKGMRGASDKASYLASPGNGGGLPPAAISTAVSTDTITATVTAPTLPSGWTITNCIAQALLDTEPQTDTQWNSWEATDNSSPYEPAITVPGAGTYRVAAFFEFTKSDGSVCYGPSINTTAEVS